MLNQKDKGKKSRGRLNQLDLRLLEKEGLHFTVEMHQRDYCRGKKITKHLRVI